DRNKWHGFELSVKFSRHFHTNKQRMLLPQTPNPMGAGKKVHISWGTISQPDVHVQISLASAIVTYLRRQAAIVDQVKCIGGNEAMPARRLTIIERRIIARIRCISNKSFASTLR